MNNRTIAQLFKLELDGMFNSWEIAKSLRVGAPHASSILQADSEWCLRRQVLLALYPEQAMHPEAKPWDAHTNAVFLNGWYIHEMFQTLMTNHGRVIEAETSHFDETRFLHFTPDVIFDFGPDRFVGEIKGYKQETFDKLDEAGEPPEAAHMQCNLYCHLLGIEHGAVIVMCKNTQRIKVWIIQHDASLAREYTERMYQVKGAVLSRHIPERACTTCRDRRAEKCPVRQFCFSGRLER